MTSTAVAQSIMLAFRSWMWVASVILWALSRKPAVTVASTRRIYMRSSLRKTLRDVGLDDQAERYREGNQGTRREVQELASNHWEGVCKDSRGERHLTNLARPRMHYTRCSEFFVIMVHQCSKSIDIFKISCGLAVQDMFMIHLLSRLLNQTVRGCSCSLSLSCHKSGLVVLSFTLFWFSWSVGFVQVHCVTIKKCWSLVAMQFAHTITNGFRAAFCYSETIDISFEKCINVSRQQTGESKLSIMASGQLPGNSKTINILCKSV